MENEPKTSGSWVALLTGFFSFAFMMAKIYFFKEQKHLSAITHEDIKEIKMSTVAVTLNVPQAEKDLIDAVLVAYNDLKNNKTASLVSDELPLIIKIVGELSELMAELKTKQSIAALAYLVQQIAGV